MQSTVPAPTPQGYYQCPHLFDNQVLFVSEGDLWVAPSSGGRAERLTGGLGALYEAYFSPDGRWIAFTGTHEGHPEIYVMPAQGGPAERRTFFDQGLSVLGWLSPTDILFKSNHESPFSSVFHLYTLSLTDVMPKPLSLGPAHALAISPEGQRVIQRHGYGYVTWKGYRGGTAGELWIEDTPQTGDFRKLLNLASNNLTPLWMGGRIYFLSDHAGQGRIYSCDPQGNDLQCHSPQHPFYVRQLSRGAAPHDTRLIYKQGADLYILDTTTGESRPIPLVYPSSCPHKARLFANPTKNLTAYAPSPHGQRVLLTTRGRLFDMPPFRGPVHQHGDPKGVRYRLGTWLSATHAIAVKDQGLVESLEIFDVTGATPPRLILHEAWGRILDLCPSPEGDRVVFTNHRHELWLVDLTTHDAKPLDKSPHGPFQGIDWSPDGHWIVYSIQISHSCAILRLCELATHTLTDITSALAKDFCPRFDSQGRFIYVLSFRTFLPHKDALRFDWAFQDGVKPYVITLRKDIVSPFILPLEDKEDDRETPPKKFKKGNKETTHLPLTIDLDGIKDRLIPFPLPSGTYNELATHGDKIYWLMEGPTSDTPEHKDPEHPAITGHLIQMYDLSTLKVDTLVGDAKTFALSQDGGWLMYVTPERKLRLIKAGEKPEEHDTSYKNGGWIEEERVRLSVDPLFEWRFMFEEAWRLQKDLFWRADMGEIDWEDIRTRYLPLVERVNSTAELMDVIGDMQGELRVSHAYAWGYGTGDGLDYTIGQLGASFTFDDATQRWVITHLDAGDRGNPDEESPLQAPGLNVTPGTHLLAIDGVPLSRDLTPAQALVHKAGSYVSLEIKHPQEKQKRTVWVKPLAHITPVRYRDWVAHNRRYVTEATQGRVGYIHIPDMVEAGFAEFFRSYMQEFDKEGLIVDVRFNNGGHISTLLLATLARKRLGFDQTRWEGQVPYLTESPHGPMVTLCNELTASDGDMFAYSFQKMGLGPLIGKRTWGGVIGIFPRHPLLDGTMTSQPEHAIWFHDIGWRLENHGATPDIVIENTPADDKAGRDMQLARGIQEILARIAPNGG